MEVALIVGQQVLIIFLLMALGLIATRRGWLTLDSANAFSAFLLTVVMPATVIKTMMRPFDPKMLPGIGLSALMALIFHIMAVIMSILFIPERENAPHRLERFTAIFSNCSFMALPILDAVLGDEGVFYGIIFVGVFLIFTWTGGIMVLTGNIKIELRKVLLNPGLIAVVIGSLCFAFSVQLTGVAGTTLNYVAALNTPLATIIAGVFVSNMNFKKTISNLHIYKAAIVRNLLLPGAMIAIIYVTGISSRVPGGDVVAMANIISAACPTAASAILMASRFGEKTAYASSIMAVSTLFSLLTMPVIVMFASAAF